MRLRDFPRLRAALEWVPLIVGYAMLAAMVWLVCTLK